MLRKIGSTRLYAIVAVVLGLACATPAGADSQLLPFFVQMSGDARFTSATTVEFRGAGIANHMGAITNIGDIVITGPPDEDGCLANINTEYLTAASGDLLVLEMDDVACPVDETGLRFEGFGNWQVIRGTGRFANATGSGTVVGFGDFVTGAFGTTITGHIAGIGGN